MTVRHKNSDNMVASEKGTRRWGSEEDRALVEVCIRHLLTNRAVIYATPALAHFNGNGGDKIDKKLQQMLRTLEGPVSGQGLTAGIVESLKGNGGVVSGVGKGKAVGKGKKRKLADSEEVETDEVV